jgi:hypothetical protein
MLTTIWLVTWNVEKPEKVKKFVQVTYGAKLKET